MCVSFLYGNDETGFCRPYNSATELKKVVFVASVSYLKDEKQYEEGKHVQNFS
jgi:hypothetical protein